MDQRNKIDNAKKFSVVEFLVPPCRTIKKYVIVPSFWVKKLKPTDQIINVAYPIENPGKTKDRCERNERPKGNWRKYMARIRFEDDNYAAANQWIVQNLDESTNTGIIERRNGDSTNNADRNIAVEHHDVPNTNGLLNTRTRGNQSATTIERKTHSSCHNAKLNGKPPVNLPLVGNNRITRMELPLPSTSSSSAMTRKQLETARKSTPTVEVQINLSNSFKDLGIENQPLTCGSNLSRGQEMVRQSIIKSRDFSQSNARNTTSVSSTSSNHSHQPVESQNEELLSTVPEGINHNHCGHQEPVPKQTMRRNCNDQSTRTMTPVTQNPIHLMKQGTPIPQNVPKSSSLIINENHVRQELHEGERLDRPTEVNRIGQRAYPQDVTDNTPSAVSMSTDCEHRPRALRKCSQEQHPPVRNENSPQNSDTLKVVITGSLELFSLVFNDKPHQVINENALFAMKNLSNATNELNQINKHSHNQWQPVNEAPIQKNFPVNDMFPIGSTGAGTNQRVPFQSSTENTEKIIPSTVQYPSNSGAHTLCSSECSQGKRYSSFIPRNHFQGIRNNDPLISGSIGENCSRLTVDPLTGINSTVRSRQLIQN